jgi:putative chitinase
MDKKVIISILSKNPDAIKWADILHELLPVYEINTNLRLVHFLAQTCHESAYYLKLEESLNYSSEALTKIWPKRFPLNLAEKYGRTKTQKANQSAIANIVYANRIGNSDEASGDGYKYRGRGLIQLTGKANYQQFSLEVFKNESVLLNPDSVAKDKNIAIHSAGWFWEKNNLNLHADKDDVIAVTKKINGGIIGIDERKKLTQEFKKSFGIGN